jgi:hypothetical protein
VLALLVSIKAPVLLPSPAVREQVVAGLARRSWYRGIELERERAGREGDVDVVLGEEAQ